MTPSLLPLSPAAAVTVTPSAAASAKAASIAVRAWPVQESSLCPQLMLIAVGVGLACTAVDDRVEETAVGVRREVDDLAAPGAERPGDLDVQQHLAVGAAAGPARRVRSRRPTPTAVTVGPVMPSPEK